jgi:hypothetical protein
MSERFLNNLFFAVLIPLIVFFFYALFVMVPVMMYTEAECLRNGYPKYAVTVGLSRYCTNLAGTVTVQVDKAGEKK